MKRMFGVIAVVAALPLVAGCVAPRHPAEAAGVALGYTVASPVLILKGLTEGISAAPRFADANLREMNAALVGANAPVDLARTYRYAYGTDLATVPENGDTGQAFRNLGPATRHFQSVLRGYGIPDAEDYLLTAVRTADAQGYTLYAVVHRPQRRIRVRTPDGGVVTLTPRDAAFYLPYDRDANGRALDVVLDWAAVPRTAVRTQKGQAVLMTIAANSVRVNRRTDDFWGIATAWRDGRFREIVRARQTAMDRRIG